MSNYIRKGDPLSKARFKIRLEQSTQLFETVASKMRDKTCDDSDEYLYLISILDLIDMFQWCAYTEEYYRPSFGEINNYVMTKIPYDRELSLCISLLSDIRCKLAHRNYVMRRYLYLKSKVYVNAVEYLYSVLADIYESLGEEITLEIRYLRS